MSPEKLLDSHALALVWTGAVVGRIPRSQLDASTPCEEWTVAGLLQHVVAGNLWAAELATGRTIAEVGDRLDGDVLGEDVTHSYAESAALADAAFRVPGALSAPCDVSYGPVPGAVFCEHRFVDVLVHGWDLAVSTSGPQTLPPGLVAACWEVVEPQLPELEASGAFGTALEPSPDAPAQDRLLTALGRDPGWTPAQARL